MIKNCSLKKYMSKTALLKRHLNIGSSKKKSIAKKHFKIAASKNIFQKHMPNCHHKDIFY